MQVNPFYMLKQNTAGQWRVYVLKQNTAGQWRVYGPYKGAWPTVQDAKAAWYYAHGVIPVRIRKGEGPYDKSNPMHVALANLEAQHTDCEVVAVGATHYLIRRPSSKYSVEQPIKYKDAGYEVRARKDSVIYHAT